MPQIFGPKSNTLARFSIFAILIIVAGVAVAQGVFYRSNYVQGVGEYVKQPVPFSHRHHVNGLGLDCRYCHSSVEKSSTAGIPPTETCMTCHSQIWTNAAMLAPVRESYGEQIPLQWVRVHELPEHVYFDHSIHVNKGIGCATCHGSVSQMPLTYQAHRFLMRDCLDCHRNPEKYVRPREEVFNENWSTTHQDVLGPQLVQEYKIDKRQLTDCHVCHR